MYFLIAFIAAFIGIVPLLIRKKITEAVVQGISTLLIGWLILYLITPPGAGPIFGFIGFIPVIWWIVAAIIDGFEEESATWAMWFPVLGLITFIIVGFSGCEMIQAQKYASLIGPMEDRVWTQDVQPKDPAHIRMGNKENAIYQAQKILGEAGAIGSQFKISQDNMTLQMIRKELWFVAPLDYDGFSVWTSTSGVPGYVMVHGEDPHRKPKLVMLPKGKEFLYTPEAYFEYNLERHLRQNGYFSKYLTDWTFEVDEEDNPWWVITVEEPTLAWGGDQVKGVLIVNPTTGAFTFYPLGEIPDWVDRAVPASLISDYLNWQGKLFGGWINSWWGSRNLTKTEKPILIYGSGDQPEWVTGVTSKSDKDDSLIALVYTNSRTGKSVRYVMNGGGTDTAIISAVKKNQDVQYRKLHPVAPQIYNIYGEPTSVVSLLNDDHAFQGVAMVSIRDIQTVAVGKDQYEALRSYEKLLSRSGSRIAVEKERILQKVEGVVDRFGSENLSGGTVYYLHLTGISHVFTAAAGEATNAVKLPLTKEGDRVRVEYYSSDQDVVPVRGFDNLSLPLSASRAQQEVRGRVEERQHTQDVQGDASAVLERLKQMKPEDLQKFLQDLSRKQ